jgi:hypothetical protein
LISTKQKDWRHYLLNTSAVLFLVSVPTLGIGSFIFGEPGVAWPTVLMAYPALIVIGAVLGFSDIFDLISGWRTGELLESNAFYVTFLIGRGLSMLFMFYVFLRLEVRLVAELLVS